MAVPKRKKSKAMRDHRRAQWMRSCPVPKVVRCECGEPRQPHRVCQSCGKYAGRTVLDIKQEETATPKA